MQNSQKDGKQAVYMQTRVRSLREGAVKWKPAAAACFQVVEVSDVLCLVPGFRSGRAQFTVQQYSGFAFRSLGKNRDFTADVCCIHVAIHCL